MALRFFIEQLALNPKDPDAARQLLADMGATSWVEDHVTAAGSVFGSPGANEANLSFNYDMFAGKELEILHYTKGQNWVASHTRGANCVSHIGMHCTAEELSLWRIFFAERKIEVAQEVFTSAHTNPAIADKRRYNYVIFDTKKILGVDLKFIVRIDIEPVA